MDTTPSQYLTFFLGEEEYAVGILDVREIIQYESVTRVPQAPPWIRGVINLRGSVVPVVDLAAKLGLTSSPPTKSTCIVVAEVQTGSERVVMGVLADSVSQVIELGPADIEPAPAFGTRVRLDYLRGMGTVGARFVLVLDIAKVLTTEELARAAEAAEPAA